jgi:hypothetical protein
MIYWQGGLGRPVTIPAEGAILTIRRFRGKG